MMKIKTEIVMSALSSMKKVDFMSTVDLKELYLQKFLLFILFGRKLPTNLKLPMLLDVTQS